MALAGGGAFAWLTLGLLLLLLGAIVATALLLRRREREAAAVASSLPSKASASSVEDSRKGFFEHIEELRRRILVVAASMLLAVILLLSFKVGFWHGIPVPIPDPYDNVSAQLLRQAFAQLVPPDVHLVVTGPTDAFMAEFHIAMGLGVILTVPVALVQFGLFLRPALRQRERRVLLRLLLPATILFALGAAFCYVAILPSAYKALYQFADVLGAVQLLQVNTFVSFTTTLSLLTGAAFQTPLVMYGLARVGLVEARTFARFWRHACVLIVIVAAWITPDPTIVSQLLVSIPLIGLYFVGIALAGMGQRTHAKSLA